MDLVKKMELQQEQKLQLQMTTELVQAIEMLQLNALEMDKLMEREAEDNVLLDLEEKRDLKTEEFVRAYRENNFQSQRERIGDEEREAPPLHPEETSVDLRDYLVEQLQDLPLVPGDRKVLLYLIDNLDEDGYLRLSMSKAARDLNMETHELFSYVKLLRTFEPKGIASGNLRECLLAQVEGEDPLLSALIENYLEELGQNRLSVIAKAMDIPVKKVQEYRDRIRRLNPKPGAGFGRGGKTEYIFPEIFVELRGEDLRIEILDSLREKLTLNPYYLELMETTKDPELLEYLRKKYERARFLLEAIEKRRQSIEKVVQAIVEVQEPFFKGEGPLRPLTLGEVAEKTDLSQSTVSRINRSKYLQCPKGVFLLKDFYPSAVGKEKTHSRDRIEGRIRELIQGEDKKKPLSDQKISDLLLQEGLEGKRRTVAKYRDEMGIPPAGQRKRF